MTVIELQGHTSRTNVRRLKSFFVRKPCSFKATRVVEMSIFFLFYILKDIPNVYQTHGLQLEYYIYINVLTITFERNKTGDIFDFFHYHSTGSILLRVDIALYK